MKIQATRSTSVVLKVIFILTGMMLIGLYGAQSFLNSASGSRWILGQLKRRFNSPGISSFTYDEATVKLFSQIEFKNLKFTQTSPNQKIDLLLPRLSLNYNFSILHRWVTLDQLQIQSPQITFESKTQPPSTSSLQPTQSSSENQSLSQLITSPFFEVRLKKVTIQNLTLKAKQILESKHSSAETQFFLEQSHLNLNAEFLKNHLTFSADLDLGNRSHVQTTKKTQENSSSLSLIPKFQGKIAGSITLKNGQWLYELLPSHLKLSLEKIKYSDETAQSQRFIQSDFIEFQNQSQFQAQTDRLFDFQEDSVRIVQTQGNLRGGRTEFSLKDSQQSQEGQIQTYEGSYHSQLGKNIGLQSELVIQKVRATPHLNQPILIRFDQTAQISKDFKYAKAWVRGKINSSEWLSLALSQDQIKPYTLSSQLKLQLPPQLAKLFTAAQSLKTLGTPQGEISLKWSSPSINDLIQKGRLELNGTVSLQTPQSNSIRLTPLTIRSQIDFEKDRIQGEGEAEAHEIQLNPQSKPWKFHLTKRFLWRAPHLTGDTRIEFSNSLWKALTQFKLNSQLDPQSTTPLPTAQILLEGDTQVTQMTQSSSIQKDLQLDQPVTIKHSYSLKEGQALAHWDVQAPEIKIPGQAKFHNTQLIAHLRVPQVSQPRVFDFELGLKQGETELANQTHFPKGFEVQVHASTDSTQSFTLDRLDLTFAQELLQLQTQASGSLKSNDFQSQGKLKVNLPREFKGLPGQSVSGKIELPWSASLYRGKDLNLRGKLELSDLKWKKQLKLESSPQRSDSQPISMELQGIHGEIPLSERWVIENQTVRFHHLIQQNPFERVHFERVQPLIQEIKPMRVESIRIDDKQLGPFQGLFSIEQNQVMAHKFDMSLGSGQLSGEFYFNAHPESLELGILSRLTQLNLSQILPSRWLNPKQTSAQPMSGRTGLVVHLNQGSMDGRTDITQIGANELLTLINVMDPRYENKRMNQLRSALGIAYPTYLSLNFQKGFLDLVVQMNGLIQQEFKITGIPITSWISSSTSQVIQSTQKGLIQ